MRPTDLSGLRVWLKADGLGLNDGDAVGSWTDLSGLGNHFTQATAGNKPTYKTNIVNGKPVVRFDGFNADFSATTADFFTGPDLMSGATAAEVFVVFKQDADPPGNGARVGFYSFGTGTVAAAHHVPYSDGTIYDGWGSTTRKTVGNPTPSLASWRLYNVSSASGAWTARLDGTQLFTTATNTVGFVSAPTLGQSYSADVARFYDFDGDMAEVVIYDSVLSTLNRNLLGGYFAQQYALTIAGATWQSLIPRRSQMRRHLINR